VVPVSSAQDPPYDRPGEPRSQEYRDTWLEGCGFAREGATFTVAVWKISEFQYVGCLKVPRLQQLSKPWHQRNASQAKRT